MKLRILLLGAFAVCSAAAQAVNQPGGGNASGIAACATPLPSCAAPGGAFCWQWAGIGNNANVTACLPDSSGGYSWQPLGGGQPSPNCGDLTLSPTSGSLFQFGGSGTLTVNVTDQNCAWTANSSQSWLTITSGSSGTGSGTIGWSASSNAGGTSSRSATITNRTSVFTASEAGTTGVNLQSIWFENSSGGTSITSPTLPFAVGANNTLVAYIWYFTSAGAITSVVTSNFESCTVISASIQTVGVFTQAVAYCPNVAGGSSYTVTASFASNSSYNAISVLEYAGVLTYDKAATATGSDASTMALGSSFTPSGSSELVIEAATIVGSAGYLWNPQSGFIQRLGGNFYNLSSIRPSSGVADQVQTSATAITNLWTTVNATGNPWAASVVAFKTANWSTAVPYVINTKAYINANAQTTHTSASFDTRGATHLLLFVGTHYTWPVPGGSSVAISSITDSAGNTWNALVAPTQFAGATFPLLSAVYDVVSPVTASNETITITLTNAAPVVFHAVVIAGGSGTPVASAFNNPGAGMTSTAVTSGPISTAANSLLVQWAKPEQVTIAFDSASTTGFSIDYGGTQAHDSGGNSNDTWTSWQPQTVMGSYSGNYTWYSANGWMSVIVGIHK